MNNIGKPDGTAEWWKASIEQLGFALLLNPGDKDIINAIKAMSYAALAANALLRTIKDRAELDELKERIRQITSARNLDQIK